MKLESKLLVMMFLMATFALQGCVYVKLSNVDGQVEIKRGVGFVNISATSDTKLIVADSKGVGIVKTPEKTFFGYNKGRIVMSAEVDNVVFWVDKSTSISQIDKLLRNYPTNNLLIYNE